MTRRYYSIALTLALSASALVAENSATTNIPMAVSIEPKAGAPGTILTVKGNSLDKSRIDEVYLTDHRFDMMVKVLEQGGESMKIRIPPFAKPGRLQLLFLTAGAKPLYLEQPLYVEIRDAEDTPAPAPVHAPTPVEISKAAPAPAPAPPAPAQVAAPAQPMPKPQPVEIAQAQPAKGQAMVADFSPEPIPTVQPAVAQPARQVAPAIVPAPVTPAPQAPQVVESRRTPARLVKRGTLKYPELARSMKREGSVDLMLTIASDGTVREVKALTGDHTLRSAAEESARTWKYEPARNGAEAVESVQNVSIAFKLR